MRKIEPNKEEFQLSINPITHKILNDCNIYLEENNENTIESCYIGTIYLNSLKMHQEIVDSLHILIGMIYF